MSRAPTLPVGTVTFLFTDAEGSTKLLHALGAEAYADALAEHRRILRDAFSGHGGVEVDTQGDAFFVAFPTAPGALAAAAQARDALAAGPIKVRIGLHTGTPHLTDEGYVGADVHRAARIAAAGHGGQILVSTATAQLIDRAELRDLGEHRLKDLSAPERIYQLGDDDHPPLTTLHQTNLPIPATPFLGRQREVAEIVGLLARDDVHLVTMTGPGGTGKTRLALQAAASAADIFPGGVWWVPLASLNDAALVLPAAATALGASEDLAQHIGDKRMLLLFDNFEHLLQAASELAALLARSPNLTLLVTSREPLHLGSEHDYDVDPLRKAEAVELFMARALSARRDFEDDGVVTQICERLDNLPLAIELAAARVKVIPPRALLERLQRALPVLATAARDAPERQRTLRATIEWSHDLLGSDEQRLFAHLAVFRGGCTLHSAEAVVEADLDTLQSLVDKSLVRMRDGHFWMLETIREFAAERLERSHEAEEIRGRHAQHFIEYAETGSAGYMDDAKASLDRLEPEHDNMRAALDLLEATDEHQSLLRLAGALARFWYSRGHMAEGKRRLERAVATDPRPTVERARALNGASLMSIEGGGEALKAKSFAEEALAIYRELGDEPGMAYSILTLAEALSDAGDWTSAQRYYEDSRRRFAELGDEHHVLLATRMLAWMHFELGELPMARAMHEENLARARALGNVRIVGTTLGALGEYDIGEGKVASALPKLMEAYEIFRELEHPLEISVELCRFAWALALVGRPDDAARVFARSLLVYEDMAVAVPAWVVPMNDECLAAIRSGLDAPAFEIATEEGRRLTIDEAVALAVETSPTS